MNSECGKEADSATTEALRREKAIPVSLLKMTPGDILRSRASVLERRADELHSEANDLRVLANSIPVAVSSGASRALEHLVRLAFLHDNS